eukprot:2447530-Rhodomonas_salina.1
MITQLKRTLHCHLRVSCNVASNGYQLQNFHDISFVRGLGNTSEFFGSPGERIQPQQAAELFENNFTIVLHDADKRHAVVRCPPAPCVLVSFITAQVLLACRLPPSRTVSRRNLTCQSTPICTGPRRELMQDQPGTGKLKTVSSCSWMGSRCGQRPPIAERPRMGQ